MTPNKAMKLSILRCRGPWMRTSRAISARSLLPTKPFAKFVVGDDIMLANVMFRS